LVIPAPPPKIPNEAADPRVPGDATAAAGKLQAITPRTDMDKRYAFDALKLFMKSPQVI
jgi:hypothetical protein